MRHTLAARLRPTEYIFQDSSCDDLWPQNRPYDPSRNIVCTPGMVASFKISCTPIAARATLLKCSPSALIGGNVKSATAPHARIEKKVLTHVYETCLQVREIMGGDLGRIGGQAHLRFDLGELWR